MISNKTLTVIALSLALTTAGYAAKEQTPVDKTAGIVSTAGSVILYPFAKAGNTVYYSAKTVAQVLKALKPATFATIEAGKLALYIGVIAAAIYGIGAATQGSYPNNYSTQFYDYAKPSVDQAVAAALPVAQQAGEFCASKFVELQHLIGQ